MKRVSGYFSRRVDQGFGALYRFHGFHVGSAILFPISAWNCASFLARNIPVFSLFPDRR